MTNLAKTFRLAFLATLVSAAFGAAQAFTVPNFSAPGIPSPGYPNFAAINFSATLTGSAQSGFTLTIDGLDPNVGVFNYKGTSYPVSNEEIELVAHFDSTGHLLTNDDNSLKIMGSIVGLQNHPRSGGAVTFWKGGWGESTLFGATLTGVGVDSKDGALGFSTDDFYGYAAQFAPNDPTESLWLYSISSALGSAWGPGASWKQFLVDLKDHTNLSRATFYDIGSIATVPLPSTAILLLGGAMSLFGFAARSKKIGLA